MKAPLFGRDSIPQRTSSFLGLIGTFVLWLIFSLCMVFIPIDSGKKEFKPVQIVLSTTPITEKQNEIEETQNAAPTTDEKLLKDVEAETEISAEKIEESENVIQPPETQKIEIPVEIPAASLPESIEKTNAADVAKPVVKSEEKVLEKTNPVPEKMPVEKIAPKTVENPKEKVPAKSIEKEPQKIVKQEKNAEPMPESEPVLYKSVDDLIAEQMNSSKKDRKEVDWDALFGDSESSSEPIEEIGKTRKVESQSSISGKVGETSTELPQKTESTSSKNRKQPENDTSYVKDRLSDIKNASVIKSSDGGSLIKASAISLGNGETSMKMDDGSERILISKPEINITESAGREIDTDRTVTISFTVLSSGNVSEISITPESTLTNRVKQEIKSQLMNWRFESASTTAIATFEFTIKKQ